MRPYWLLAVGAFISVLIVTATNLYAPQLIQLLIDDGIEGQNMSGIFWAVGGLLLIAIFYLLFSRMGPLFGKVQKLLGQLIAFNSYLAYLLMQLGGLSQQLASATASGKRLFGVLDAENEITSPANPVTFDGSMRGEVVFENVSFAYQGSAENVLTDVSFTASPGHTVALDGYYAGLLKAQELK